MLKKKNRNTESYLPFLSSHIDSLTTALKAKLTPTLCFHHKQQQPQLSRCYQGTKVKPFDSVVIAQQFYLPMLHHYSACLDHCQEIASPLRTQRERGAAESKTSFSHRVNHKASLTGLSCILLLSQTADRPNHHSGFGGRQPVLPPSVFEMSYAKSHFQN